MKNNKGFTLIEVICSVALLSIIIVASSAFFKGVYISQRGNKDQLYANNIAQEVMEEVIRTGDLTKDYTASYGKSEYTIEVTSEPNAATIGGNGKDLNGDGLIDQKDRDLAATMYPDRPTTTKIPITYEATNVPDVGSTKKPEGTWAPIKDFDGSPFNIHLDMVDFIDEDLESLIAAGKILKSKTDAPYTLEEVKAVLNADSDFTKYKTGASAGTRANNLEKACVFYRYLTASQIENILPELETRHKEITDKIKNDLTNASANGASYIGANYSKLIDEIMNSYNPVASLTRLYEERDKIVNTTDGSGNVKNSGFKSLNGVPANNVRSLLNTGWIIENPYNAIRKAKVDQQGGPTMLSKFMDNNDNCITYITRQYTNKVDDYYQKDDVYDGYGNKVPDSDERPTIRFQLYGHYLNLYTLNNINDGPFSEGQIKWSNQGDSNSSIPSVTAPLGIKLINLPYEKPAAQAVAEGRTEGWYFYPNVLHEFTFLVTGGMSYLPVKITADFYPYSGADYFYDLESDTRVPYSPRVNYYKEIEYGKDLYQFKLCDPNNWISLNKESNYDPDGETKHTGGGNGGGGGGNGGSIDDDHGVQRQKVTLWLELNVDQTDLYTVRVKDKKGRVISELICDGNQALFKAV